MSKPTRVRPDSSERVLWRAQAERWAEKEQGEVSYTPNALFYLGVTVPSRSVRPFSFPSAEVPSRTGTLDRELAARMGFRSGRCVACGGKALWSDGDDDRLLIGCLSRCSGQSGIAPLATWLQRRWNPEYRCSPILYAVGHALRLLAVKLIPSATVEPNRHLRRAIRRGERDAATAWSVFRRLVSARWFACPDMTEMPMSAGFIAARLRDEDGRRISYRRARRIVALLERTKMLRRTGTTETSRHHTVKLYVQPQPVETPNAAPMLPQFLSVRPGEVVNTETGEVLPVEHLEAVISERSTGPPGLLAGAA